MGRWLRPRSMEEALAMLAADPALTPFAGGTDLYPTRAARFAWGQGSPDAFLDLGALPGLAAIEETPAHWRIGARVTWAALRDAALPPAFDALRAAAREVGGAQIQNRGTIAGNLCNASPAADGVPPLLALDAEVELASRRGLRRLPVERFLLGNRHTARAADELVTTVLVPKRGGEIRSGFEKLGARRYLVISIVMAAGVLRLEQGRILDAAVSVGACAPVARRLPILEAALCGTRPGALTVASAHLTGLAPIDDPRASAGYRAEAVLAVVQRLLAKLGAEAGARAA